MNYKEAYAKALRLLNVRFLSEGELRQKLRSRDVSEEIIDDVLSMLKKEHFIDDERLAADVYRYYARKGQYGHLYIVNKLRHRQLPVPEEREPLDEYRLAEQLVAKRFADTETDSRKIARFLQNRGFSTSVIRDMMDRFA
ncbi:MAG TPA: RecX family transcriptional regulator [Treponema sp.]|nr:RecX family transcriptional regulator [Treponema sp.]